MHLLTQTVDFILFIWRPNSSTQLNKVFIPALRKVDNEYKQHTMQQHEHYNFNELCNKKRHNNTCITKQKARKTTDIRA